MTDDFPDLEQNVKDAVQMALQWDGLGMLASTFEIQKGLEITVQTKEETYPFTRYMGLDEKGHMKFEVDRTRPVLQRPWGVLVRPDGRQYLGDCTCVVVKHKGQELRFAFPQRDVDSEAIAKKIRSKFAKHDWMTEGF